MNKIQESFNNDKSLIPYICAGDPNLNQTEELIYTLSNSGANIIELGIPYSDPLADGPVIQAASQRALKNGTTLKKIISMTHRLDNIKTPLVLMGYYNSFLKYGKKQFITDIKDTNIAGVIIPDLPYEEDENFYKNLNENGISGILLVAPNTSAKRLQYLGNNSTGFLYCVSLLGVTGDKRGPFKQIDEYINRVRENVDLPLALGFGIDSSKKAKQVSQYVDVIIIGSAIIKIINKYHKNSSKMMNQVKKFVKDIKSAITD